MDILLLILRYHVTINPRKHTSWEWHPGSGLPLVLLSAKLTSERILNAIGIPEPQRGFEFMPAGVPTKEIVFE